MKRFENWPCLLSDFFTSREISAFQYGVQDCSLFAADAVLCMTGVDPAQSLRGKYSTEAGAARILKRRGGLEKVAEKLAIDNRMEEVSPRMAQRGDVVLIDSPDGEALGVVNLSGSVSGQGPHGIMHYPLSVARRAWRVG